MRDVRARHRTGAPAAALAWVMAFVLAATGCGDRGPASAPGVLSASVVSPNGAEGAARVTLIGQGLGAVGSADGRVFSEAHGDTVYVVVVNQAGGTLRFTVEVADTTRRPAGTLLEVSGPDNKVRGLAGYALEIRP